MNILQKNSFETNGSFEKSPVILLKQSPDELQLLATHPDFYFGSLSNGVDNLENFTSEMEWSFFVPVGFPCVFSNWYSYVSTPPAFPAGKHCDVNRNRAKSWSARQRSQRVRALRINGGCHATLDGNEGGNDRFSCVGIVSFYSIAKIFCEYKKWC